jgi:uncharacterized membrane protein
VTRPARDDDGSVLPLVIGFVVVVLLLVGAVTDASVLWLQRRALQSTVDGAALAGAQAIDLDAVYAGGARGDLALASTATVRRAVRRYLAATPSDDGLPQFRLTSTTVEGSVVTVAARSTVSLPFTTLLTGRGVAVRADASAVLRVP